MASPTQQLKRLIRRQLLLTWLAVGSAWVYSFTLVGEASWNLGWTILLWILFTTGFAAVSLKLVNKTEAIQRDIDDRISNLEMRMDEVESESAE